MKRKKKRNKRKLKLIDFSERKNEALRNQKVKSLIDFDEEYSSIIKSLAVEQSTNDIFYKTFSIQKKIVKL